MRESVEAVEAEGSCEVDLRSLCGPNQRRYQFILKKIILWVFSESHGLIKLIVNWVEGIAIFLWEMRVRGKLKGKEGDRTVLPKGFNCKWIEVRKGAIEVSWK